MDDDILIMCEICGCDLLLSVALWHECVDAERQDGMAPLCPECDAENPTGNCPND